MRILWLKSDLLLPLDKGGRLRTWHLLRHLARRHDITYVSFADPDTAADRREGMREVAARIETVRRSDPPKGSARFYADAAMHLVDPLPYAVGKYRSRRYADLADALLQSGDYDLVVCDFLVPAVNLRGTVPCPAVIFTHNVESEIWRRHAETRRGPLRRALYRTQYRRMLRFEARTLARFDGVLTVSSADRETLERLYPDSLRARPWVVPTGVDTEYFAPATHTERPAHLVFTGSMDWLPNEDAMLFFYREVLPRIRAEMPDVSLSIVGRAPTRAVARLADDPRIEVTGRVADVRPHVRDAAVYIVPLRIGGGTRLKIFEAMSMGKAVVSTTVGAEGLDVRDGEHLVLADGAEAFARSVIALLKDVERRRRLEAAARTLVVSQYDWARVAAELERALVRFAVRPVVAAAPPIAAPDSSLIRFLRPARGLATTAGADGAAPQSEP